MRQEDIRRRSAAESEHATSRPRRHPWQLRVLVASRQLANARKFDAHASRATYRPSAAISSPARSKRSPSSRSVSCQCARRGRPTAGARCACAGASERLTTTRWRESGRRPAPRDQLAVRVVVRPAVAVAQPPVAVAQVRVRDGAQQPCVERAQIRGRAARPGPRPEEDRDPRAPAVELAVVVEPRARQRGHHDRRRARLPGPEGRRRARLVVVLDEAHQPLLVGRVGLQVPAHRLGGLVDEPVVEPLVVAVVEALLLERPLHVPVRLGDEQRCPGARP